MIKTTHEISNVDGYVKYNFFEIHPDLETIIADDYFTYARNDFKKQEQCEELYKKNFYDKYDEVTYKDVYEKYINNENFKAKAMFIYSVVDFDKYTKFVESNKEIINPNELTLSYSVLDSAGVKIDIYNLSIIDISFVF